MNNVPAIADWTDPVRQLSDWLQGTDITRLELCGPDTRIALHRQGTQWLQVAQAPVAAAATADATAPTHVTSVRAPCVGVLHLSPPGRAQPLVSAGQTVGEGQPLAVLQIGLVLVPVLAPRAGVVQLAEAVDGAAVGYGTPLFTLA